MTGVHKVLGSALTHSTIRNTSETHNALQSFVNHLLSSNAKLNGAAAAH